MVVVVGGHSRNIGKTSVICGIVRALQSWRWIAIKLTSHDHVANEDAGTDTGRYLAAGAERAFLLRPSEAAPRIPENENAIIESNSILRSLQPDLCLIVLDGAVQDFKPSCLEFLPRADFLVTTSDAELKWPQVPPGLLEDKPRFAALPPACENADLIAAISNHCRIGNSR
jgi:hypothetical protein